MSPLLSIHTAYTEKDVCDRVGAESTGYTKAPSIGLKRF